MTDDAILELARGAGIAECWVDAAGHQQYVGIESLRQILDALGFPSATVADIAESRERLRRGGSSADELPPMVTMQAGARLSLPESAIDRGAVAELVLEDGSVRAIRLASRRNRALGSVIDQCGYHRLRMRDRELTVAVAPPSCVTLKQVGAGKRMWGVAAQVYGLRRPGDGGIGDATAVRQLAEAAAQRGADAVALSPVHALFAADPGRYGPYSPSSRLFLNPLFADAAVLFGVERVAQHATPAASEFEGARLIDWRPRAQAKLAMLQRLFADFREHDMAARTGLATDFARFVCEGGEALRDHALFEALHGKWAVGEAAKGNWADWPSGWRHPGDTAIAGYLQAEAGTVEYHQFLQWVTERSFAAAQASAIDAGMRIGLIGDLAIGMDRAGSHAWARQDDMLLGLSIGAPPDAFNLRGQDWGLAGFSPQALVAKGFEPFLSTLRASLRHAGGVRLDHVMGLMRLWFIPGGAAASEGAYLSYPLDDLLRLIALESHRHDAIVIGEDLGTVPPGFRNRLRRTGIAGMDVLWFQRTRSTYRSPARWRADAVAMTTTHDLATVAGWWRGSDVTVRRELGLAGGDEDDTRRADQRRLWQAFRRRGVVDGKPPPPDDPAPVVDAALAFVAGSPAPLMLAPLEDMLGTADQPNLPGTIDEHPNWRRRLDPLAKALFDEPQVQRRAGIIAPGADMIPRATLRLQFHRGFTFADAARMVSYFARLGVSHVYASPIAVARPGSMHGYDVIDPTRVNPELGGEDGLRALAAGLRNAGLGLIVDIVPNHMAADVANAWWRDVLRRGRASCFGSYFDIDWEAEDPDLRGKVLLPLLGQPLREVLTDGELGIASDAGGQPAIRYFSHFFPLADGSIEQTAPLSEVLGRQHYRLSSWHTAGDRINWRRFFDVNELVCLRMEEPAAFEAVHALPLRLYGEGVIDGLRIDHVDGLTDPAAYCRTLRRRLDELARERHRPRAYMVIEKILLGGESLPVGWGCDGTTGYDFMNDVSALQHDGDGKEALAENWAAISGRPASFAPEERTARREIVARSFSAQLDACAASFQTAMGGIVPRPALRRVLTELLVHFPVYRTYGADGVLSDQDGAVLCVAAAGAARTCLATDRWAVDAILDCVTQPLSASAPIDDWQRALARLQQLSAPVAAKSVEDTAFYRYGRLLSRNDVGFDAERLSLEPADFHARVLARQATHPNAMLATATHDHKRGEDVRARLAVLSEIAEEWSRVLRSWIEASAPLRRPVDGRLAPAMGDVAMFLQTMVGAWPLDLDAADGERRAAFAERLADWQVKALREAKLESDWAAVDKGYEAAARDFIVKLVIDMAMPGLLDDIAHFARRIAPAGAINGLTQCLLKLTVPGVPDIYQGTEFWDFSLVDPDNRRPVDFQLRAACEGRGLADLAGGWRDGRIKQALIARTLALRRQVPRLFSEGTYRPVRVEGEGNRSVVAFVRRWEHEWALVLVPRLTHGLLGGDDDISLSIDAWKDATLILDDSPPSLPLYDALGGGVVEILHERLKPDLLCGSVPLALVSTVAPNRSVEKRP